MRRETHVEIPEADVHRLEAWLPDAPIPPEFQKTILALCKLFEHAKERELGRKAAVDRLREAMGVSPTSERGQQAKSEEASGQKARFGRRFQTRRLEPAKPEKQLERLFTTLKVEEAVESEERQVERGQASGLRSEWYKRTLWDLKLVLTKKEINVETVTDPVSGLRITAPVDEAPPGGNHTYGTIVLLTELHVAHLIPTQRLARMLSSERKSFSSSLIWSFVHDLAVAMAPVYFEMARRLGKEASQFQVDDTKPRVLEPRREADVSKKRPLAELVDDFLPTRRTRKNLALSVISAQVDPKDEHSRIVFFRTHRSTAGELLTTLVERFPEHKERCITVIQDMSRDSTPKLPHVRVAGCSAHARRPFWRHRELDPERTYLVLRCFAALSDLESRVDSAIPEKKLRIRKQFGKKVWAILLRGAQEVRKRWPPQSELGRAAKYILSHEKELTLYLEDPSLPWTNNLSERLLRREKIMLANSKFRATLEGRTAIDILSSVMATARLAGVAWHDYATAVLKNRDEVLDFPECWLPRAFALRKF